MNRIVLSIGSNCCERELQMSNCIDMLSKLLIDIEVSHIYETPALNDVDNSYLNGVVKGGIQFEYDELKLKFKQYEKDCGRTPDSKKKGVIPIDIDIVIWNDEILKNQDFNQSYFQIGWKCLNSK